MFADREEEPPDHFREMSQAVLDAWFGFDYELDDGSVVVDHLLEDKRLSAGERAYLKAMRGSTMRLYEVTATVPGATITLRDVVEGTTITVNGWTWASCGSSARCATSSPTPSKA